MGNTVYSSHNPTVDWPEAGGALQIPAARRRWQAASIAYAARVRTHAMSLAAAAAAPSSDAPPAEPESSPATLTNPGGAMSAARAVARNAAASTLGASVVALLVTPLDVVKVRMQAHVCPVGGALPCADPMHPAGVLDAMRKIAAAEGAPALWRGLPVTLALAVPTTGLYFTVYEALRARAPPDLAGPVAALCAGAAARVVAATAASPLELARTALQAGATGREQSVGALLRGLYARRGASALWRGLGPTLARDVPFSAVYWAGYATLKDPARSPLPRSMFRGGNERAVPLVAGIVAGSAAALATIPADVVKTRRQAAAARSAAACGPECGVVGSVKPTPAGVRGIVREIVRNEGVRGLFKGAAPRVAKVGPSCAIMMGSYELFRGWLGAEGRSL